MNTYRSGAVAIITVLLASTTLANAPMPKIGVVGSANESTVAVNQDKEQRRLKTGDDIYLNDTIQTDAKGAAQIMFLDKSALTVNPGSAVTIDEFVYNPATSSGQMSLNSAKGAMRFIGGALSKKQPVNIKTPVATIGIRGGIADVNVNARTGATESIFVYGKEMTTENENGMRTTTTQMGRGFSVDSAGAPPRAMDLAQIAATIGEFHDQTTSGSTPGALPDASAVDSRVDSSVGDSNNSGGSAPSGTSNGNQGSENNNSDGSNGQSAGNSGDAPPQSSDQNQEAQPPVNESGDANTVDQRGTQLASDGPSEGRAFGPDRMGGRFETAQANFQSGVPNALPPIQNLTSNAAQDDTRTKVDALPGNNPNAPRLPVAGSLPPVSSTPPNTNTPSSVTPPAGTVLPDNTANVSNPPPPTAADFFPPTTVNPLPVTHRGLFSVRNGPLAVNIDGIGSNSLRVNTNGKLTGDMFDVTDGTTVSDVLFDKPGAAGFFGANPINASGDGKSFSGFAYSSVNESMYFYRLENTISAAEKLTMLTGEQIANANIAGAAAQTTSIYGINGVTFYNFLPDVLRYDNGNIFGVGVFNYNMQNPSDLLNGTTYSGISPMLNGGSNTGLAVDWTTGNYFTGHLNWGSSSVGGGLISAFGKVDKTPSAGNPVLSGGIYRFKPEFGNGSITVADSDVGVTRVKNDVYGKPSGTVDGMLFESAIKPDAVALGDGLYAVSAGVEQGRQPVTVYNGGTLPTSAHNTQLTNQLSSTRDSGTYKGFAGGVIVRDATGTPSREHVLNANPNDVTITRNASGNGIGATLKVTSQTTANLAFEGKFGADAGNPNQAFVRNQVYAMGQGSMDTINSGTPTAAHNAKEGVLASSSTLANAPAFETQLTNSTQYAHWGVWAAETDRTVGTKDVVNMVPYVAGEITPATYTPAGDVTYNGGILASKTVTVGGYNYNETGTFSMDINLNTRSVALTDMDIPNMSITNLTGTGSMHATDQNFQGMALSGGGITSGTMNGAVFGPAAENVGGNFTVNNSTAYTVTGVFIGQK